MEGAGVIYINNDKILMLRRSNSGDNANSWDFPGGHKKGSETSEQTAKRESKEETGILPKNSIGSIKTNGFVIYLAKMDKPERVKLNHEHNRSKWVKIKDVGDLNLHPKVRKHWPFYMKEIQKRHAKNFKEWLLIDE